MAKKETLEKVIEIIAGQLSVDKENINKETDILNDLGADSLDAVEIVMALEEKFDIEISDEEAAEITKVNDIAGFIDKRS